MNSRKRLRNNLASTILADDLSQVYNSYDIIGDIAIIKAPNISTATIQSIATTIMTVNGNIKTVLAQIGGVTGNFRLRPLTHVRGDNKTNTIHREFGCQFSVDVADCYFSPRLSAERYRIATLVRSKEIVLNMFSGVGCFSIMIAKKANPEKVYSIDINPSAVRYMRENIRLNSLNDIVIPLQGDSGQIVDVRFKKSADRVLLPLPEKALEYLPYAVAALEKSGGWIHYYDFVHAKKTENPIAKTKLKVANCLEKLLVPFEVPYSHVVRKTGPNWYQIALDIHLLDNPDKF